MRVRRQSIAVDFLAEVQQLFFGQASFEISPGIQARCAVALKVDAVAAVVLAFGMPEVIEARAEHRRGRSERADVAAQVAAVLGMQPVGLDDHGHCIPAHVGAKALFDLEIARATLFVLRLDGVDVGGRRGKRCVDAVLAGFLEQLLDEEMAPIASFGLDHGCERIEPLPCFLCVLVVCGCAEHVLGLG
jgi:hypothetical protein